MLVSEPNLSAAPLREEAWCLRCIAARNPFIYFHTPLKLLHTSLGNPMARHALRLPMSERSLGTRPIRVPATELPTPSMVMALRRLFLTCLIASRHSASIHSRLAPGVPASPIISTGIFVPPGTSSCSGIKVTSRRVPLFLPTPSTTLAVTTGAECDQVFHRIVTKPAPRFHMMNLQAFHGTALLTPPTISLQDPSSEYPVLLRIQF